MSAIQFLRCKFPVIGTESSNTGNPLIEIFFRIAITCQPVIVCCILMLKGEILFWSLISYWSCTPLLLLASSWTCLFPVPLMWFNESSKLQYACSQFTEREPPSHKWRLIPRGVCSERWQFEMDWWYWTLSMQATAVCRILYGLHTENMHSYLELFTRYNQ